MRRTGILEIDVRPGMTGRQWSAPARSACSRWRSSVGSARHGYSSDARASPGARRGDGGDRDVERQDEYPEPGFDLVFEAAGTPDGARTCGRACAARRHRRPRRISGNPAGSTRTRSCSGTCACRIFGASRNAWRWVTELFADGLLDTKPLVTHSFPLDQHDAAFATLAERGGDALKVQLTPAAERSRADVAGGRSPSKATRSCRYQPRRPDEHVATVGLADPRSPRMQRGGRRRVRELARHARRRGARTVLRRAADLVDERAEAIGRDLTREEAGRRRRGGRRDAARGGDPALLRGSDA